MTSFFNYLINIKFKKLRKIADTKTDIVILDQFGFEWLVFCLPSKSNYVLIPSDSLPYILKIKFFFLIIRKYFEGNTRLLSLYCSLIETLDTKIVITFNDNNTIMGKLQEKFPDKLIISVQNGNREDQADSVGDWGMGTPIPNYYGFGEYEKDLMLNLGVRVKSYIKAGSLKMGMVLSQCQSIMLEEKYDICFISGFRVKQDKKKMSFYTSKFVWDTMKLLFDIIVKICSKKGYRICVAMFAEKDSTNNWRSDQDYEREMDFYKKGNECENIDYCSIDYLKMGSYKTSLKSKLIIGMASTLLFENLGARKKVLISGFVHPLKTQTTKEYAYRHIPSDLLIYEIEKNHIRDKIEVLMNMTDVEYLDKTSFARNYYMRCERPYPHEMIKKQIAEHLNIPTE